jgi:hypothetical protein
MRDPVYPRSHKLPVKTDPIALPCEKSCFEIHFMRSQNAKANWTGRTRWCSFCSCIPDHRVTMDLAISRQLTHPLFEQPSHLLIPFLHLDLSLLLLSLAVRSRVTKQGRRLVRVFAEEMNGLECWTMCLENTFDHLREMTHDMESVSTLHFEWHLGPLMWLHEQGHQHGLDSSAERRDVFSANLQKWLPDDQEADPQVFPSLN